MEEVKIIETLEEKETRLQKEKEKRQEYKDKMKRYEKYGALKFQKIVFKVEEWKFKILKAFFPNFINYFDKYIDKKKNEKIKRIRKKVSRKDKIKNKYPKLLELYDKFYTFKEKIKNNYKKVKETIRKKVNDINPNIVEFYDDYLKYEDPLRDLEPNDKIKKLITLNKYSKMFMRKEIYQEKNRNYHIDSKRPTIIYEYLKWNKKVHVKGILSNAILIPTFICLSIAGFSFAPPLLIWELISAGINFECINIQNYNICRYKISEKKLKKEEKRKTEESIREYEPAQKLIYKSMIKQEEIPNFDEIITNATDIEQIRKLRLLIQNDMQERQLEKQKKKTK